MLMKYMVAWYRKNTAQRLEGRDWCMLIYVRIGPWQEDEQVSKAKFILG